MTILTLRFRVHVQFPGVGLQGALLLALHQPCHQLLHRVCLEQLLVQGLREALMVVLVRALLQHGHWRQGEDGNVLPLLEGRLVVTLTTA